MLQLFSNQHRSAGCLRRASSVSQSSAVAHSSRLRLRSAAPAVAKTSAAAPATADADGAQQELQQISGLLSTLTAPGMDVAELKLTMGDLQLKVVRQTPPTPAPPAPVAPAAPVQQQEQQQQRPARRAPAYASMSLDGDDDSVEDESMVYVTANRVGTFKRGRSKAKVGDQVRKGDVLGAIEQLGMMTDVKGGEIVSFKAGEGDPVEYHQPLVCIAPYFGVEETGVTSVRGV